MKAPEKIFLVIILLAPGLLAADRKFSPAQWAEMRKGKVITEVHNEGGTRNRARSAGWFSQPPDLVFRAVASLELYDEYMERVTTSVLLDEAARDRVVKGGALAAEEAERLFAGMRRGWRKDLGGGKYLVYSYQCNRLPWPVNDRWVLTELVNDPATLTQTWKRLAGNITVDYGSWQLSAAPGGGTLAIMQITLDLNIPATGPFTAFAMDVTLPDTYAGLKKITAALSTGKQ